MHRIPTIGLITATVIAPLFIAAPASAATLPSGDALFTISCDWGQGAPGLYELDADTALATLVGLTGDDDCAGAAAYDPTTGTSYYVSTMIGGATFARADTGTGAATTIVALPFDLTTPISMAIGLDGAAYAIGPTNLLYSFDLTTGARTLIGALAPLPPADFMFSFAVDPTSGDFYGITVAAGDVFRIDVATAAVTLIGNVSSVNPDDDENAGVLALQIDTSGRWWMTVQGDQGESIPPLLFSTPLPSGDTSPEAEGVINTSAVEQELLVRSLLLTYPDTAPALPATGAVVPMGAVAAAVMLLAVGAVAFSRAGARRPRTRSSG